MTQASGAGDGLRLVRWTCTTGSSGTARAAVVLAAGDHQWDASADGPGAIGTLCDAVDTALEAVLGGRVRLVSFDVHAIGETAQADALVELAIEPPASATGERASGRYSGSARHVNLVAACAEAYLAAISALLADDAWAGATEAAVNRRLAEVRAQAARSSARASLADAPDLEPTDWFNR
jgi:hypothetical protein